MLFSEMMADIGYSCDSSGTRSLLQRAPTAVDDALHEYYGNTRRTAWRDSNFGVLRSRGV